MKQEIIENYSLYLGDNIQWLKTLPNDSVDSVLTDPPYGLTSIVKRFGKANSKDAQYGTDGVFKRSSKGFMGKEWDSDVPSVEFWREVYRILKPGGHILSFGGTRTYHRMATSIEDAGFEIRDQLQWIYASGFPKSHNIGKAIDSQIITGKSNPKSINVCELNKTDGKIIKTSQPNNGILGQKKNIIKKIGATLESESAQKWQEWGTGLKPANEPICLARKPISERTIALNVIKHGTGGINIDGCRIEYTSFNDEKHQQNIRKGIGEFFGGAGKSICVDPVSTGRFPSNVLIDESIGKILDEQSGIKKSVGSIRRKNTSTNPTSFDLNHKTGENSNPYFGQEGGASRFFYCPKVSKKERDMGLEDFGSKAQRTTIGGTRDFNARCANCGKKFIGSPNSICSCNNPITDNQIFKKKNNHPTVKPINLMSYLVRLITPPGGTVIDPFMGSGSCGIATLLEGFNFIGMEQDPEYFEIATARIKEYESYREVLTKPKKTKREIVIVEKDLEIGEPVSTFWLNQAV